MLLGFKISIICIKIYILDIEEWFDMVRKYYHSLISVLVLPFSFYHLWKSKMKFPRQHEKKRDDDLHIEQRVWSHATTASNQNDQIMRWRYLDKNFPTPTSWPQSPLTSWSRKEIRTKTSTQNPCKNRAFCREASSPMPENLWAKPVFNLPQRVGCHDRKVFLPHRNVTLDLPRPQDKTKKETTDNGNVELRFSNWEI